MSTVRRPILTQFFILLDAEQKAHFLFMTRNCHSPDVFVSEPEPETDDDEAHVGYDDVEVEGMSCDDDEIDQTADSDNDERTPMTRRSTTLYGLLNWEV